jgi:hypothetical protein
MSNQMKKDMDAFKQKAQKYDFTKFDNQFSKHEAGKSEQKRIGDVAVNHFGRPEAIFIYGKDRVSTPMEFTVDIDVSEIDPDGNPIKNPLQASLNVVGAQLLCPKCFSSLYVKGKGLPEGKEIVVHWNNMVKSENDGLMRPKISIDGILKCDYYGYEIVGDASGTSGFKKGTSSRCGWQGGLIKGVMFDHS